MAALAPATATAIKQRYVPATSHSDPLNVDALVDMLLVISTMLPFTDDMKSSSTEGFIHYYFSRSIGHMRCITKPLDIKKDDVDRLKKAFNVDGVKTKLLDCINSAAVDIVGVLLQIEASLLLALAIFSFPNVVYTGSKTRAGSGKDDLASGVISGRGFKPLFNEHAINEYTLMIRVLQLCSGVFRDLALGRFSDVKVVYYIPGDEASSAQRESVSNVVFVLQQDALGKLRDIGCMTPEGHSLQIGRKFLYLIAKATQRNCETCFLAKANVSMFKCSKCLRKRYCSTQCQQRHWKSEHKLSCRASGVFMKDDLVVLHGLVKAPHLNRRFMIVRGPAPDVTGRWMVFKLDESDGIGGVSSKSLSVKADNMYLIAAANEIQNVSDHQTYSYSYF